MHTVQSATQSEHQSVPTRHVSLFLHRDINLGMLASRRMSPAHMSACIVLAACSVIERRAVPRSRPPRATDASRARRRKGGRQVLGGCMRRDADACASSLDGIVSWSHAERGASRTWDDVRGRHHRHRRSRVCEPRLCTSLRLIHPALNQHAIRVVACKRGGGNKVTAADRKSTLHALGLIRREPLTAVGEVGGEGRLPIVAALDVRYSK